MKLGGALVLLAALHVAEAVRSATPKDYLTEAAQEEKLAISAFSDAVPFVEGIVADISRLQRGLRKAESFIQLVSQPATKTTNKTLSAKSLASPNTTEFDRMEWQKIQKEAENKTAALEPPTAAGQKKALLAKGAANKERFDTQKALEAAKSMGAAQMPAMLGLMKGMYATWKDKISAANKKEEQQKKKLEVEIARLEEKKRNNRNDANATKWYDSMERYWKKQRALSHQQYHTSLKMMHAGMEKMKTMIGVMGDAVAGKKPTKKELASVGVTVQPEVVLLLQRQAKQLTTWAKGASSILRSARNPSPGIQYSKACQADSPSE